MPSVALCKPSISYSFTALSQLTYQPFPIERLRHILNKNLIPTSDLIISLYNPSTAPKHITDSNIPLRRGDFTDPSTLQTAFEGADILFLVSYPGFSGITDLRIKSHAAAIDAAKKAGIKRIVYTSLSFGGKSGHDTTAVVAHAHIATAKLLRECGLEYTILREAPYAETWNLYAGLLPSKVLKTTGDVDMVVPSDVSARFCAREDLGEASAKVLEKIWSNPVSRRRLLRKIRMWVVHSYTFLSFLHRNRSRMNQSSSKAPTQPPSLTLHIYSRNKPDVRSISVSSQNPKSSRTTLRNNL